MCRRSRWTSFFWSRRRDWEQAFGSLYYGLLSKRASGSVGGGRRERNGGHDEAGGVREGFYLQSPRYTVLWRLVREGVSGGDSSSGRWVMAPLSLHIYILRSISHVGWFGSLWLSPSGCPVTKTVAWGTLTRLKPRNVFHTTAKYFVHKKWVRVHFVKGFPRGLEPPP